MNSKLYQLVRKVYWKLPFSDETKEAIVGFVKRTIRKTKQQPNIADAGKIDTTKDDYIHQVLSSAKPASSEYVAESGDHYERKDGDAKIIAYYLTQFHPNPENDEWWGKGVTEWNNVCRAKPQFVGHSQPRLPGELGFYDLRLKENMLRQVELAKNYGVYGFSFYYYWFDGARLLERPLDLFMNNPDIDFPFALCWANESWTRRFDGTCGEILMEQSDSVESYQAFIDSVIPYMQDSRYIKVAGKPLLTVYRPSFIPDCKNVLQHWRDKCAEAGIGDIHIVGVKEHTWDRDLLSLGFDAQSEFHPGTLFRHCNDITHTIKFVQPKFEGLVLDYEDIVVNKKYFKYNYETLYRAVMPMWDNTARRDNKGMIFHKSSPALYKTWLQDVIGEANQRKDIEDKLIFINAWNEWGEGAYLEPDREYGYAYLQATRDAVESSRDNK
ncbi:glycoside hydrolase family 99-like domain-containing protein [Lelliottia sp. RWM.1]|uniref:glycosyltransferase WbsX family protein n=1 Tax=Lelliottia sp. RWM.1 TaxID=2663242 RepID=UPI00193EA251|nr:glycoside hydrolase family 99-like domain-containing protein [Lelliottia sp. RWM.1]MBM3071003.1 glycosyl hydrolase [Lelliottia sp. RWM.1]